MDYIPRNHEREIRLFIEKPDRDKEILLIEGARQVGKTTTVNECLRGTSRNLIRINLEKEALFRSKIDGCKEFIDFEVLLEDECGFDRSQKTILFIDESQESRQLGTFVRFMKEEWPETTVILSGSTLSRLFRDHHRYPVGRVRQIKISPFSFSEFLRAQNDLKQAEIIAENRVGSINESRHTWLLNAYSRFLNTGGLPMVVGDYLAGENHTRRLEQIFADYEQDFIRLFDEESLPMVNSCISSVAHFVGSVYKNTTIIPSPSSGTNERINSIFQRLESWHLVLKAQQIGLNPNHGYSYLPKRYLFDTGLMVHLSGTPVPKNCLTMPGSQAVKTNLGGVLENQLAVDIARRSKNLKGWKKSSAGGEIDFIYNQAGMQLPIECKTTAKVKKTHLKGLVDYLNIYDLARGYVVSCAPYSEIPMGDKTIVNIPFYLAENIHSFVGA